MHLIYMLHAFLDFFLCLMPNWTFQLFWLFSTKYSLNFPFPGMCIRKVLSMSVCFHYCPRLFVWHFTVRIWEGFLKKNLLISWHFTTESAVLLNEQVCNRKLLFWHRLSDYFFTMNFVTSTITSICSIVLQAYSLARTIMENKRQFIKMRGNSFPHRLYSKTHWTFFLKIKNNWKKSFPLCLKCRQWQKFFLQVSRNQKLFSFK